jgi:cell division protein DivIC
VKSSVCRYLRTVTMNWTDKLKLVIPLLRNKFVLTGLIFIVWMLFFDQNNLIDRFSLAARIKDLEKQKEHYQQQILENRTKMEELRSNHENLEKFAREEYLMKKDDEELFIIIED